LIDEPKGAADAMQCVHELLATFPDHDAERVNERDDNE
jgi:hypothetical protein